MTSNSGLDQIIDHVEAVSSLRGMIAENRLPGALLFTGPMGVGKRTTALRAAEEILGRPLSEALEDESGHYAEDMIYYRCSEIKGREITLHGVKMSGGVEFIRSQVIERLSLRPAGGGTRLVILADFDEMNHVVWDTLLKTLEEPPAGTHFILTTSRRGLLPITILSRCHEVVFARLSKEACARVLCHRTDWDEASCSEWSTLSGGSPGRSIKLAGTNLKARLKAAEAYLSGTGPVVPFDLSKELKGDRAGAAELAVLLARRIKERFTDDGELVKGGLGARRLEALQALVEAADDLTDAGINPDPALVMDNVLLSLRLCGC